MLLRLLGTPRKEVDQKVTALPLRRSSWLLFYLAYVQEWVQRENLILFLRPESEKEVGSLYLRQLLTEARKLPWARDLEIEADRLRWQVETDVAQFKRAAAEGRWFEAVNLYGGSFLEGLNASYLPTYETWMEIERAALEQTWRDVTLHYLGDLEASSHFREAATLAKKLCDNDNLDEEALQNYLRNAYLSGQRHQALQTAATFTQTIQSELGLQPTPTTLELIEQIKLGQPLPQRAVTRRYGRRRSDRLKVAPERAEHLYEVIETLKMPNNRLLAVNATGGKQATLLIATQVADIDTALSAMVILAEQLLSLDHKDRALELLLQVWNHSGSSKHLRGHIASLFNEYDLRLPTE